MSTGTMKNSNDNAASGKLVDKNEWKQVGCIPYENKKSM